MCNESCKCEELLLNNRRVMKAEYMKSYCSITCIMKETVYEDLLLNNMCVMKTEYMKNYCSITDV
jgi:hypothetical protein